MSPRILLLGGHGKVSLLLTPLLVQRSWHVISVIRDPAQTPTILEAGKNGPGKVEVLVEGLEDVKSDGDAKRILEKAKPDWVVWSAGAGGKGGANRTNAIDRDAAIHFIRSGIATPSIKKFLMVSAFSSRHARAPWWDDESWALVQHMNTKILPAYYVAKLAADEVLTTLGKKRAAAEENEKSKNGNGNGGEKATTGSFQYIDLRPGGLSDEPATGKVQLGKTKAKGMVSRGDVADVAARLLERDDARGWFDLLGGEEEVGEAVERVVREGVDSIEGEDVEKFGA